MKIRLLDFAPDLDNTIFPTKGGTQGYLTDANWVYSTKGGWGVMPTPQPPPGNPHIPSKCLGCFRYQTSANVVLIVMATASQLYVYNGSGPAVSQGLVLANAVNPWSFTNYGTIAGLPDTWAVNGVDPPQISINGGPWMLAPGNPPVFSLIEATDFSLFGIIPNSSEYWFTFNDTIWIADIATQTGFNFLTSTSGNITAIHRLRAGAAMFKATSLFSAVFTGPPLFWATPNVSEAVGTRNQDAATNADDVLFFLGPNDFYSFDGYSLNVIQNNLRDWFFRTADPNFLNTVRSSYDQPRRQVVWYFSSTSAAVPGQLDRYIAFSLVTGQWVPGYLLIEAPIVNSGIDLYAYVDITHSLQYFTGSDNRAVGWITTGPIGDKANMWRIGRVQPGWLMMPAGDPLPIPAMPRLDVFSTYIPGQPDQPIATARWSPQTGFFDLVCAGRMQRLKTSLYPGMSISDLDVDLTFAGKQ